MNNITEQISKIENNINSGNYSSSDIDRYKKQIEELRSIIDWLSYQCSALYQATYDNETKELVLKMKNTTRFHFKTVSFNIETGDKSKIPITVIDWKPNITKSISFYHDFNNDEGYRARKVLKLSIDVNSVCYEFYDNNAYFNTGNDEDKKFVKPNRFARIQGYLVIIRTFCDTIKEYDLRAKARMLESLIITIYDRVSMKPELESKVAKIEEAYLPTVCKSLDSYTDAINKGAAGSNTDEISKNVNDGLNALIVAMTKIKDDLYSDCALETAIETTAMKSMMERDGLL